MSRLKGGERRRTTTRRFVAALALGGVAGLLSGMFGVGGGVLIVPGLVMMLSVDQRLAHGTSLAAIVPISLAGVVGFLFHGLVAFPVAGLLVAGSVVGALIGSRLLDQLPQRALRLTFSGLLLLTAIRLFVVLPETSAVVIIGTATALAYVATGFAIGVLSGTLGVGGGVFLVPALVLLFGLSDDLAKGTSLLMVLPTALIGTIANVRRGNADLQMAGLVGIGGVLSALLGAQVAVLMDQRLSLVLFGVLLAVTAIRLAWRG